MRDIRAIFESQKRTLGSRLGRPMATNPAHCAIQFRCLRNILDQNLDKDKADFCIVRYEDLVREPDRILDEILGFMDVGRDKKLSGSNYLETIPSKPPSRGICTGELRMSL